MDTCVANIITNSNIEMHGQTWQDCQRHKLVKHNQTIHRQQPTNCLSVFDHFVGLARKGLRKP